MFHKICPICESNKLRLLKKFSNPALMQCGDCRFTFCGQIPSRDELNKYYQNYGIDQYLSPITRIRYNEWLDNFETFRLTGNLLDVGCGSGYFLDEAKKRGWNVFGTEYSDAHVEFCSRKGIKMWKGVISEEMFPGIRFDIITSLEVIEHVTNPRRELEITSMKLRDGGLFFCTTPNFNALSRYLLGSKYNIISYPEHLSYFTSGTLTKLCTISGLQKIRTETTGISITRFMQSQGKSDQKVVSASSNDELLRQKIEKRLWLQWMKSILNFILKATGLGYSLKGWYVKVKK